MEKLFFKLLRYSVSIAIFFNAVKPSSHFSAFQIVENSQCASECRDRNGHTEM